MEIKINSHDFSSSRDNLLPSERASAQSKEKQKNVREIKISWFNYFKLLTSLFKIKFFRLFVKLKVEIEACT